MKKKKGNLKAHKPILCHSDPSLLTLIIDVTPSEWQDRDTIRLVRDKINASKKRSSSSGPASFNEYISSITAFCVSFGMLNRDNTLCVIAVAGDYVAMVYPRVGKPYGYMESIVHDPTEFVGTKTDARKLYDGVLLGVAELIMKFQNSNIDPSKTNPKKGAAMVCTFLLDFFLFMNHHFIN